MHDFHPGKNDYVDSEEYDELLGEESEINNVVEQEILNQHIFIMYNNDISDEEAQIARTADTISGEITDEESLQLMQDSDLDEAVQNAEQRHRIIDELDPNDEEDDIVKRIILEHKKPRSKPPNIYTEDYPTDISFHPSNNIVAISTITGDVLIYKYENDENKLLYTHEIHSKAIRDIEFSVDGRDMFSASRDKSIVLSDFETGKFKRFWDDAHEEPIYTMTVVNENLITSGDDSGTVKLWDLRCRENSPVFSIKESEDFISCITVDSQKRFLICTSGDGFMTTLNIANKKKQMQSEEYEEELTCSGLFRNESKIVIGSSKGNFYSFNWGEFAYHCDSFVGPQPTPISFMVPITEKIAITAGEDGKIRALHMFPGRILGIVGQHSLAIESMDLSHDGEIIATSSHDNDVCFWNIKYFEDFDSIAYNSKQNTANVSNNLPSSLNRNRADFFSDLA